MKQIICNWFKKAIIRLILLWDNNLSIFCLSIIMVIMSIANHSILYLLPLCIGIELSIFIYSTYKNYRHYTEKMIKDSNLFSDLKKPDENLEQQYLSEISKLPHFKGGNRYGTKKIYSYISQNLGGHAESYTFYSDESIILLHKNFDEEADIDRFSWIHEMCHCCWHSLIGTKQISTRVYTILLTLVAITFAIALHSWWMVLLALPIGVVLFKLEGYVYVKTREEMGADAMAFSIFAKFYGIDKMKHIAKILTNRYFEVLIAPQNQLGMHARINTICNSLCFTTEENQKRFREKLKEKIAEADSNPESKQLRSKLISLDLQICNLRQYDSFDNGFFTLNPALYYILFPILLCLASYTMMRFSIMVTIPWQCILLSIIPIAIIIYLWVRIQQWKDKKSVFLNIKINK